MLVKIFHYLSEKVNGLGTVAPGEDITVISLVELLRVFPTVVGLANPS